MMTEVFDNYEVLMQEDLPDISSRGTILRHKKTGARVMLIRNEDENKVFNITFRTTPKDSTGVAHITEHSVLCGSRNFPLKDPFVELVKGSLNTFLNAMTYPDKTCYPVASCNDQDFRNLMHVYLDAVFYPNIYSREEIFRQEGWNYHLEKPEGPLTINGVVYNEMKGAFSSPDDVLEREIMNSLFPDTTYGKESGGDPADIPSLSYEAFLDFHRTYYHPSNSYIYLYGNMDVRDTLRFIDEAYLSHFGKLSVDSAIKVQKHFDALREIEKKYPVSEEEGTEKNTYLSWNLVMGDFPDPELALALNILDYALLSAPGAPLKKALLEAGIGNDIYGSAGDGILQPYFTVVAKGSDPEKKEQFLSVIHDVLSDIVRNGIDQKAVEAGINYMEFRYREADYASYPKGLMYGLDILENWLYSDEAPFAQVQQLKLFEKMKKVLPEGYFEDLIRKCFLENQNGSVLILRPEVNLTAKREKALEDSLAAFLSGLSEEEKISMAERTKALSAYQDADEDPEAVKCIPMLRRSDIKKEIQPLYNKEYDLDGSLFLHHDVNTNGIGYLDLMFEVPVRDPDSIHTLGLLKAVIGYVDTEHYTYGDLFNEINASTGGIVCGTEMFEREDYRDGYKVMFSVRGKALYTSIGKMFGLIREILFTSKLYDKKRLREIIGEGRSKLQAGLVEAGHATAMMRAASYGSASASFTEELAGIGFYDFIDDCFRHFEERCEDLAERMEKLLAKLLSPGRFYISYTGDRESAETVMQECRELKKLLKDVPLPAEQKKHMNAKRSEGFSTAGQVQYVAKAGNFKKKNLPYTGALEILRVILGYDYLWNNVRVKGGAYGCMNGYKRSGLGYYVSYRDPHLSRTLEIYDKIPEYIENFTADEREMTKYIIGTISSRDVPRTPKMKGSISRTAYFDGLTEESLQKERDQILGAGVEDIRALSAYARAVLECEQICVVGNETALRKADGILKEVRPLIRGEVLQDENAADEAPEA